MDQRVRKHFYPGYEPIPERRRITKVSPSSPCKVGEVVTVKRWGTFGCWDEQGRWVDFYNSERV
jgi:hypothetical protein